MSQQSVEDFYRGRKIDLIIGYSSGGTYDLYARLVARFLGNYIPGKPLIVPRNMRSLRIRRSVASRNRTCTASAGSEPMLERR